MDERNLFGLYSVEGDGVVEESIFEESGVQEQQLFDELSRLVPDVEEEVEESLSGDLVAQIETFSGREKARMKQYLAMRPKGQVRPSRLAFFEGWSEGRRSESCHQGPFSSSGGFFFSWENVGVVVNPGRDFLERFHAQGYHVRDIDHVIVTSDDEELYRDLISLYQLNLKVNRAADETHLIRYNLHRGVHQKISPYLKPAFKQERDMVRSLDLFVDSANGETLELSPHLHLRYLLPRQSEENEKSSFLLAFDLFSDAKDSISFVYASKTSFNEKLIEAVRGVDLAILGFGHTKSNDLGKLEMTRDCLGYFGSWSLLEKTAPKLAILSDFSGTEGDIRLEVSKKMRQESKKGIDLLPAGIGLEIDLPSLQVLCNLTKKWVAKDTVKVLKPTHPFAPLTYLSTDFLL